MAFAQLPPPPTHQNLMVHPLSLHSLRAQQSDVQSMPAELISG